MKISAHKNRRTKNTYKQTKKRKKERRFFEIQKVGESCH
jgi:hypothetical protein